MESSDLPRLLLDALTRVHSDVARGGAPARSFEALLETLLEVSASSFGFIGEVQQHADGQPFLRTWALTDISWDENSRQFHAQHADEGLAFENLDTLFGAVLRSGEVLLSNQPSEHPESGGLPAGHPPLHSFAGIPLKIDATLVGMVGLANRPGGYDASLLDDWDPLLLGIATTMQALRVTRDRARLNSDVSRAHAELKLANERLRLATEAAEIGVWDWNVTTDTLIWSPKMFGLYGLDQAQELDFDTWRSTLHPEDAERAVAEVQAALDGSAPFNSRFLIQLPSGERRVLRGIGSIERNEAGEPLRMIGANWDITTEEQQAEQALHTHRLEAIGELTGGVAHDFNNILAVVSGSLDLLRDELGGADPGKLIDTALEAVRRGSGLTDRLLNFARRQSLNPCPVDIAKLLQNMGEMLRRTMAKDVQVCIETSNCQGSAHCDPSHLENVIVNLAVNARDAMPKHGELRITAESLRLDGTANQERYDLEPGSYIRIRVADQGVGMQPAVLARACEPYFTTKALGRGTGLGLSSAQGFAAQSGGTLHIESREGSGTRVDLLLPRTDAGSMAVAPRQEREAPPTKGPSPTALRILLVEDNDELRQVVATQLRALGHKPMQAAEGATALKLLEGSAEIDFLLSDVLLPGEFSGPDLVAIARERGFGGKVLLMTGYAGPLRGAAATLPLLHKPFTRGQLERALRAAYRAPQREAEDEQRHEAEGS